MPSGQKNGGTGPRPTRSRQTPGSDPRDREPHAVRGSVRPLCITPQRPAGAAHAGALHRVRTCPRRALREGLGGVSRPKGGTREVWPIIATPCSPGLGGQAAPPSPRLCVRGRLSRRARDRVRRPVGTGRCRGGRRGPSAAPPKSDRRRRACGRRAARSCRRSRRRCPGSRR